MKNTQVKGDDGEKIALNFLKEYYFHKKCDEGNNLIKKVIIQDKTKEFLGYDFLVKIKYFNNNEINRYVEVKYRSDDKKYSLTSNERKFAEEHKLYYDLVIISDKKLYYYEGFFEERKIPKTSHNFPKTLATVTKDLY